MEFLFQNLARNSGLQEDGMYASRHIISERVEQIIPLGESMRIIFFGPRIHAEEAAFPPSEIESQDAHDIRVDRDGKKLAFEEIMRNDEENHRKMQWEVGR